MALSKDRSPNAVEWSPVEWRFASVIPDGRKFKITTGIFNSIIGFQTCKAIGIESAIGLTKAQALELGPKVEKWLAAQDKNGRK